MSKPEDDKRKRTAKGIVVPPIPKGRLVVTK
jgi:hypothetical protein